MDLSKAKLGSYDHERGVRTLYVPCAEDDDPREQTKPAAKPKAKRKVPRTPKEDK